MSILSKAKTLSLIVSNPHIVTCRTNYLFIFSHMRSRSSVLSHVLGSNPEVCGYSELHRHYASRLDLLKMRAELYEDSRCKLSNKYLLDKLLHDHCYVSNEVFEAVKPKVIFLLREPEGTLKSIINMGYRTGVAWYRDAEQASRYYCARLASLENYAIRLGPGYFVVDADDLVDKTEEVLAELGDWLRLGKPLEKNYARFRHTGKRHYGDSSENIQSGIIRKTEGYPGVHVPANLLRNAEVAYQRCKQRLVANNTRLRLVKQRRWA